MASISRDENGTRRIQFVAGDGKRRTVRLGAVTAKQAEAVRVRIEQLASALVTGIMDPEAAAWVKGLDARMHDRLARVGLVPARIRIRTTLGGLLAAFFETLSVKPGTLTTYAQTRASLEAHFGAGALLTTIGTLEAERWRQAMKESGLSEATVSKRVKTARQVFRRAVKWSMIPANPLDDVKAGAQTNRERMHYVTPDDAAKVLEACPDHEWRLLFALSRFGGLRCPSEHLALTWADVDWAGNRILVRSAKTEGHDGRAYRYVPLFPELLPHLREAFERAEPGATWVVSRYRDRNCNLRTHLRRIIRRAGLAPWPRLFHNLRSSRQTELAERFPIHVVCAWLGNTRAVASDHYLQVTPEHFDAAAAGVGTLTGSASKAAQNPAHRAVQKAAQQAAASGGGPSQECGFDRESPSETRDYANTGDGPRNRQVTPTGFEPVSRP